MITPVPTEDQTVAIKESFALVASSADEFARQFYERLFEVAPEVREMFPSDLTDQRQKLIQTLSVVINAESIQKVENTIRALGSKHKGYGALPDHYPVVGAVLLETLASSLGYSLDHPTIEAWAAFYNRVASLMQEGLPQVIQTEVDTGPLGARHNPDRNRP